LEFTYAYKNTPAVEERALDIFAVEDNILYRIRYQPWSATSYHDNIPIIRKMIESVEILDTKGMSPEIF
jgi:hypothetical protein